VLRDLRATSELRGERNEIAWGWDDPDDRPAFRLLRRERAWPENAETDPDVVDLSRWMRAVDDPWDRVSELRLTASTPAVEGGMRQGDVALQWSGGAEPARAIVRIWDGAGAAMHSSVVEDVTRVEVAESAAAPWDRVETIDIFHDPGGGEVPAGTFTLRRGHTDGATPDEAVWDAAGEAAITAPFDELRAVHRLPTLLRRTARALKVRWTSITSAAGGDLAGALQDPALIPDDERTVQGEVHLTDRFSEDTGAWSRDVRVSDGTAAIERASYYAVLRPDPMDAASWLGDRRWRTRATATGHRGHPERLYQSVPAQHRTWDEPTPESRGHGALRRFLDIFGTGLDHLHGSAEALRTRHDIAEARSDLLPALSAWIAWPSDRTTPLAAQRADLRFAPRIYRTVGTMPTLTALVERTTGWSCRAREFVHRVCRTNAPETVPIWELWSATHDGTDFGSPSRFTAVERFDGRPALARDAGGDAWLAWHSDREGRREIWTQRLDGVDPAPHRVTEGAPDDDPAAPWSDLSPTLLADGGGILMVWASDRSGSWELWSRRLTPGGTDAPIRVTDHPANDRRPALVRNESGNPALVWMSDRSGTSDVWSMEHDGVAWSAPLRLTAAPGIEGDPAAAVDAAGRFRIVWRREEGGGTRLWSRVRDAGVWGAPEPLEAGTVGEWRDAAPSLVLRGADLWLVWHSDRSGVWEVWARVHDGTSWGAPVRVTRDPDADKEPCALVDGANLRLFWRSQRQARVRRSRTVDTTDLGALEGRGSYHDVLHYTYDTGRDNADRYARDTVGVFLGSEPATPAEFAERVAVARAWFEPFRPVNTRLVWIPEDAAAEELIDVDALLDDAFEDEVT